MNEHTDREQEIFGQAMNYAGEKRAAFLADACAGQPEMLERINSLLSAMDGVEKDGFLNKPTGGMSDNELTPELGGAEDNDEERNGSVIGNYTLIEQIGQGGFGSVFLAEQSNPISRRVAIKVIKLGMDTRHVIARFEAERQALALMNHPSIARVYDAGSTSRGRPYFAMELVHGRPITRYCDEARMSVTARLRLFQEVCAAVQHAHQKGVIHRDIKPSNVLVSDQDGKAMPKVIDFGVAKAVDRQLSDQSLHTEMHQVIGTPAYMSPEQAGLDKGGVDTRSDVYSLGVLLYELLTGETPFEASNTGSGGHDETMRAIREVTPPRPSTHISSLGAAEDIAAARQADPKRLQLEVRGDLDWIVMRAIEKDRSRRYESPGAFAADIERHMRNESVEASPPSLGYSVKKFARRHRTGLVFAGLLLLVLAGGLIGTSLFAMRAVDSERDALNQAETANRELERASEIKDMLSEMLTSISPEVARGRDTSVLRSILDSTAVRIEQGEIMDETVRTDISATLTEVYWKIGEAETAERFARSVYAAQQARFGTDAYETARARDRLALILEELGDWDGAKTLFEQNVTVVTAESFQNGRFAIEARMSYLNLLAQGMPNPEVQSGLETLLVDARKTLGDKEELTMGVAHALARQYLLMKRNAEAHELMTEVVTSMRQTMDPDAPRLIMALTTLGSNSVMFSRYDEAELQLNEALERGLRVFGEDHPRVPSIMDSLAYLYMLTGRTTEAADVSGRSIELRTAALGADHPAVIGSTANYGAFLTNAGQSERAAAVLDDVLDRARKVLGPKHPITMRALNNLGSVLMRLGRLDEARLMLEDNYAIKTELFGANHSNTIPTTINLATIYARQGKRKQAIELLEGVYEVRVATQGPTERGRLDAALFLAPLLIEEGNFERARLVMLAEMPGMKEAWGVENSDGTMRFGADLATGLMLLGRSSFGLGDFESGTDELLEGFNLVAPENLPEDGKSLNQKAREIAGYLAEIYARRHELEPEAGFDTLTDKYRELSDSES